MKSAYLCEPTDIVASKIVQETRSNLDLTHRLSVRLRHTFHDAPGEIVCNLWGRKGMASLWKQRECQ